MLRTILKKLKITDIIVLSLMLIIGYYAIAFIVSGVVIREALFYRDLNLVITSTSWVPLIRLVNTLLDVQVFNRVGLIEVISALLLLIKGFSAIDMIFIVGYLIVLYFYLFKNISNQYFMSSFYLINLFVGLSLGLLVASSLAAINSLVYANADPLTVAPVFALIYIAFGVIFFIAILSFIGFYFYIRWIYHKL